MTTPKREALEPINMQDVRLVCGEGKLEAKHVLEAVNIILKQRTERAALSSPSPDRLSEEERATVETFRKSPEKYSEYQIRVALLAIIDRLSRPPEVNRAARYFLDVALTEGHVVSRAMRDAAEKLAAALGSELTPARQPEAVPVAWIEFADNGNIRFWTSDPARAWTEGDNGRPLRKFTLTELVALAASPRLDRERLAQILLDRFLERGKVRRLGGAPTFPDGTKIADLPPSYKDDFLADADAIMRETR